VLDHFGIRNRKTSNEMKNILCRYNAWINRLTLWERVILILVMLTLGSIWLIYDVTPIRR
jgi:hypothetical protein